MSKAKTPAQAASPGTVRVRMYRQGLGDCFLLTFPKEDGSPFFLLIDCGVILGTADPETRMTRVAEDIKETTGGHIHVLVATHEHWDHLSGFVQAREVFEQMTFENVWLAWTEDPSDPLARRLKGERRKALRALHEGIALLADADAARQFKEVLSFFGDLGAQGGAKTEDALTFLREHGQALRFCRPNEPPLPLPGVPGVRIYVLGPPEDEALIKKTNPSKKTAETYSVSAALSSEDAFLAAVRHRTAGGHMHLTADERDVHELSFPFDEDSKIPVKDAKGDEFFEKHYGFKAGADTWRRIDDDWLAAAGPLALQLDNATNNTSLALAIELTASGQVLLFPGDAQVGNWLSWERCAWSVADGAGRRQVTAADLLARTVLYKVGHHASHNATLRAKGLELMTSPELVAMIPVDHDMAVKKRWDMPFQALLKRLQEKTSGRVLRVDTGLEGRPKAMPAARWKTFQNRVTVTDLAIEYSITL